MQKLLIATSNPGKFSEYREHLSDLSLELCSLKDFGLSSIEETGKTFKENAILKAKTYFEQSGLPCIADDGGLEIEILNGAPGVKSHRWATGDENVTDDQLIAYTLEQMKNVPKEKRGARMRLVMAFIDSHGNISTEEATVEGTIAYEPAQHRIEGFPFRALLSISKFGKMYDDLTEEEHEVINHRVIALQKLKPVIQKFFLL